MNEDQKLRRAALEAEYSRLNPRQREAVFHVKGPLLVLSGAGSGKTSVLTQRIAYMMRFGNAYNSEADPAFSEEERAHIRACLAAGKLDARAEDLLAEDPVDPYNILAITFTNKAAREMRERIEALVGDRAGKLWVSTFHAACCRILRRDIEKLGYSNNFTIYDDEDQMSILKDILKQMNLSDKTYPPRELKSKLGGAKMNMLSPDEFFAQSEKDFRMQKITDIYRLYEERLKHNNALDFDDLLLKTLELFVSVPPVLDHYRRRFRYILVDEYQDTNRVQYEFIHALTTGENNLCVVGDDDQSIYGWRGADIRNILDFEKDYKNCHTVKLEQNYRSTNRILEAANAVIAHNAGRKSKRLWSERGEGEPILVAALPDEQSEAGFVCREILRLHAEGMKYQEMAILYRTNAQSRVPEEHLIFSGVPYRVYGGQRFYDRKEIKDILAYLRLSVNPNDDIALRRIINEPRRGIGDATVETLARSAQDTGESMLGAAMEAEEIPGLGSRACAAVQKFADLMGDLFARKETMGVSEYVDYALHATGIFAQYDKIDDESQQRMENIKEFLGAIREYESTAEAPSLEDYLEQAALVTDVDGLAENSGAVTLMTMHSAKGLEFQAVFVLGLEDGLFPGSRSFTDENRLEEERRLCYVAITRAKDQLFLTYVQKRMLYGTPQYNRPSRFLKELPQDLVHTIDQTVERRRETKPRERAAVSFSRGGLAPTVSHAQEPPRRPAPGSLQAGDAVEHRKFGRGTVIAVKGTIAQVAFAGQGIKELDIQFAPMEKIQR